MWTRLQHPAHLEFYEKFQDHRRDWGEDWRPMMRAVQYLQNQPYAAALFAYTSLHWFCVTTASSYDEAEEFSTPAVGIEWSCREHQFFLTFDHSWGASCRDERTCEERQFAVAIDALINRLFILGRDGQIPID